MNNETIDPNPDSQDSLGARCPEERRTKTAPPAIYNLDMPASADRDRGRDIYMNSVPVACKDCHGEEGEGNGVLARGVGNPHPRNFRCESSMAGVTPGQMYWIIKNGSRYTGMAPARGLSDQQIWDVVKFVREDLMTLAPTPTLIDEPIRETCFNFNRDCPDELTCRPIDAEESVQQCLPLGLVGDLCDDHDDCKSGVCQGEEVFSAGHCL
jgi:mono/diheme cytochrome c family protein